MDTKIVRYFRHLMHEHVILNRLIRSPFGYSLRKVFRKSKAHVNDFVPWDVDAYSAHRQKQIERCAVQYEDIREEGLLSFITTVWNTDVEFLEVLRDSLLNQRGGYGFEWLVLDNGSTAPETLDFLETLKTLPFVRLLRVEDNLGIIGGMRYVLERATGRYVLPLDSDDYLYESCVSIFTQTIQNNNYPPLLYSDEDKLEGGDYRDAYYKPDWDPVLFVHSCYIAHLCAIDRELALSLGAYSDPQMEACHDWDTFLRFYLAGHTPVHVPELLYSWRMHALSTAGNIDSKPEVFNSHIALQTKFINSAKTESEYRVEKSPLFQGTPDWRLKRTRGTSPSLTTFLMADDVNNVKARFDSGNYPDHHTYVISTRIDLKGLLEEIKKVSNNTEIVHLLWDGVSVQGNDWAQEALSVMELFPDTVMVGGRIWDKQNKILSAGVKFGFGQGFGMPDKGRYRGDPGYFATMWKPHSVSAVSTQHCLVKKEFLVRALETFIDLKADIDLVTLGLWLGAEAMEQQKRIVYSPFICGLAEADWHNQMRKNGISVFKKHKKHLIPDRRYYSLHLGLEGRTAYKPVETEL